LIEKLNQTALLVLDSHISCEWHLACTAVLCFESAIRNSHGKVVGARAS